MARAAKRCFFLLLSAAMAGASLDMITTLVADHEEMPTAVRVLLGSLLTLALTGIIAYPGFVFSLWKALPDSYYRVSNRSRINRLAGLLGIGLFRRILMAFFWGHARNRAKFFDGTRRGLEAFDVETRRAEFGHLLACVLVLLAFLWLAFHGVRTAPGAVLLSNLFLNMYPIALQRVHRSRLTPMLRRLKPEGPTTDRRPPPRSAASASRVRRHRLRR